MGHIEEALEAMKAADLIPLDRTTAIKPGRNERETPLVSDTLMPGTPMERLHSALNFLPAICPLWATCCEELTHWKRPWCWERLKAGGEGDDRGWDGWMASLTQWTWAWASSRRWWWTGRPGVLQSLGLQRVGQDWATELNWTMPSFLKLDSYSS